MPSLPAAAAAEAASPLQKLYDLGVTDAEQLFALGNTEEGRQALATTLEVSKPTVDSLVEEARAALPPSTKSELEFPAPPIYGLGAVEPPTAEGTGAGALTPPAGAAAIPAAVNLIGHMPPIRNQGPSRGTCVAFTLTAINEYVRRQTAATPPNLSEQHLYHEIKLIDGAPNLCATWQKKGAEILKNHGQCREAVWPYNPNPPCNNNGVMPPNARTDAAGFKLSLDAVTPAQDVATIKAMLADRRPVGITIPVYNSWLQSPETRRSGRITLPLLGELPVGGHAVCLVGYQDTPLVVGGGYFLVRNSWGTSWAYQSPYGQGYGAIAYRYVTLMSWETYTLTSSPPAAGPAPTSAAPERTITITVRGNVNLVIE
jgi:C1A family cysteine protease